jgi:hypothetical protein
MPARHIVAILMDDRDKTALTVQKIMTGWGCMIKTRLGLHDGVLDSCTQTGLIILEMVGSAEKIAEFVHKLDLVAGVQAKHITLELA